MIGIMDGIHVVQVFVQVNANVPNLIQKSAILAMNILDRDPFLKIEWDVNAPNYRCTYDLHKINTSEQINLFVAKNGKNKSYDENYDIFL